MRSLPRFPALLVSVMLASTVLIAWADGPGTRSDTTGDNAPVHSAPLNLPSDREARKKLDTSRSYIQTQSWPEAIRFLQSILDSPIDIALVDRGQAGKQAGRIDSARGQAVRLLTGLPAAGREYYEVAYGPTARSLLVTAQARGDTPLLEDVARRYSTTRAGTEAVELLAIHLLDRGHYELAAAWFDQLLRLDRQKLAPATRFSAALAFRRVGQRQRAEEVWKELAAHAAPVGVRLGQRSIPLAQLQAAFEADPGKRVSSNWLVFRGGLHRAAEAAGAVPYLERRWQAATAEGEALHLLEQAARAQEQGTDPLLPGSFPLAVNGMVYCRGAGSVRALDLASGQERWRTPLGLALDSLLGQAGRKVQLRSWMSFYTAPGPALLDGSVPPPPASNVVPGAMLDNTLLGTLSSDGRRIYAIDDLPLPPPPALLQPLPDGRRRPLGPLADAMQGNRLVALEASTGELAWSIGGRGTLDGAYFLGPPLPVAGRLYTLAETQGEMSLICLDPQQGSVVWAQPLIAPASRLQQDPLRHMQALHLAFAGGVLVCPTHAGAVLGFDLPTRSLVWAHVYRGPADTSHQDPAGVRAGQAFWQASAPVIAGNKVLIAPGDSPTLRCLDLRDGNLVWQADRQGDDLYLAGAWHGNVVLVGRGSCRALRLADGQTVAWRTATGVPSGHGVSDGRNYYLPLRRGAVAVLDLESGSLTAVAESPTSAVPGNLLFHRDEMVAADAVSVTAFSSAAARLAQLEERLARDPKDAAALASRGELRFSRGELPGALADLRQASVSLPAGAVRGRVRERLFEALLQLLQRDFAAGEQHLDECRTLCRPEGEDPGQAIERARRSRLLCLIARGRESQPGRLREAVQAYRALIESGPDQQPVRVPDDANLTTRPDAWARAQLANNPQARQLLEASLKANALAAPTSLGPAALERLVALLDGTSPEAALLLSERLADQPGRLLEAEQMLLTLRTAGEPRIAARALAGLARLYARAGSLEDATDCYRALGRDYSTVAAEAGRTGAELWETLPGDKRFLPYLSQPRSRWRQGHFQGTEVPLAPRSLPMLVCFEPRGDRVALWRSNQLELDLAGARLRLVDGTTGQERWGQTLNLGGLRNQLLQVGLYPLRTVCQVRGHLAVLSLGAQVLGLDLFEQRILWQWKPVEPPVKSVIASGPGMGLVAPVSDFSTAELRLAGKLGPLGAGYVLVTSGRGLNALDPLRGTVLWTRSDTPADPELLGDDHRVYLLTDEHRVRCYRGGDGALTDAPEGPAPRDGSESINGRTILTFDGEAKPALLRLYDLQLGRDVWRIESAGRTLQLQAEYSPFTGLVDASGMLRIVEWKTGREVLRARLDPTHLRDVQRASLLHDDEGFYVALHREVRPADGVEGSAWPHLQGPRSVPVHGLVYAFERSTGQLRWFNRVDHQFLIGDRFAETPLLLFAAAYNRASDPPGGASLAVFGVLAIDKKTGKRVYNREFLNNGSQFHAIHAKPELGVVELEAHALKVRLSQK